MDKDFYKLCQQKNDCLQAQYETERKYIYNKYNQEFTVLEGFFDFCIELGKVLDSYIPEPEKPFLQFALLRIHERALKISREAKIMMENGSASGAIARWRTLFEFSVVANILIKYPDLAQKYIDYAAVDDYKFARRLVEYQDRLNLFHYDLSAFHDIEMAYRNVKAKYSWTGKQDYEWAKNDEIKAPNLFNLAKAVGLEHLYAYVDEAHKYNHPCMRYLLNDRGSKPTEDDLQSYLFSPSGIELPVQLTAISLQTINCAVIAGYAQLSSANGEQLGCYLLQNKDFPATIIELVKERILKQEGQTDAD